jgi:hypothetical protein
LTSAARARSQERYEELQRRGEEPDILVTRSFARALLFALDDSSEQSADEDENAEED